MTAAILAAVVAGGGVVASAAVLIAPARRRALVAGSSRQSWAVAGVALAVMVLDSGLKPVHLPQLLPLAGVMLAGDATSGFFMAVIGCVAAVVGIYSIG